MTIGDKSRVGDLFMLKLVKSTSWQDWVFFALRWVFLLTMAVVMALQPSQQFQERLLDASGALMVGGGLALGLLLFIIVPKLRELAGYYIIASDAVLTGTFVLLSQLDPFLTTIIISALITAGMLRLGPSWGIFHIGGQGLALVTVIAIHHDILARYDISSMGPALLDALTPFAGLLPVALIFAVIAGLWVTVYNAKDIYRRSDISQRMQSQARQLRQLRESARAVSRLGASLNATLLFDSILDSALDIGRISLRLPAHQRLVSIVFLFASDDTLQIATSRGLSHLDEQRHLYGRSGIIAQALSEARPIISSSVGHDPELSEFHALRTIRSTLIIPLRARFDNFGLLLYGSEEPDAFSRDQISVLEAMGTQATIALQNAVLYRNLRDEKEKLIEIEERARKALVRDLHDVPTQTMSAVAMRLGIIPQMLSQAPAEVEQEVAEIRQMALRATEEIRHVLFTLRPLALESSGLTAALRQLADNMLKTHGQQVHIQVESDAEQYLDQNQQGTLFYLIEEAVNNAYKYAQASLIRVSVRQQGQFVTTTIADNGVGFDAHAVMANYANRGSFGMINMRERAELIDGTFEVRSQPGRGTAITVAVPISGQQRTEQENKVPPATKLEMTARKR